MSKDQQEIPWGSTPAPTAPTPDQATIDPSGLKGLWVPHEILHAPDLTWQEKILLTYIYHLDSSEHHCYASNKYLGELIGCKEKTIANVISSLKTKGAVETVAWDGKIRKLMVKLSNIW